MAKYKGYLPLNFQMVYFQKLIFDIKLILMHTGVGFTELRNL